MTPNTPADVASLPARLLAVAERLDPANTKPLSGDNLRTFAQVVAELRDIAAALTPAGEGGLPPERVEDDKDWEFIGRCMKECGAGSDEGEDGIFWMFNLAAMKKLRRLATTEQPGSRVQGEVLAYCRDGDIAERVLARGGGAVWLTAKPDGDFCVAICTTPPPAPAAEQEVPHGGDNGVVPLDLEQHEREALNYLGSALKDRNAKRAVDKALALCDFYAGRNQLTFCHRDLLQRKLLPAAAPAVAKMWLELVEQIAAPLNCRASEHVDANAHVIAAARRLAANQPEARGVEGMVLVPSKLPDSGIGFIIDFINTNIGAIAPSKMWTGLLEKLAAAPEPVRVDDAKDAARWRSFRKVVSIHADGMTPERWDKREDDFMADYADAYGSAALANQEPPHDH